MLLHSKDHLTRLQRPNKRNQQRSRIVFDERVHFLMRVARECSFSARSNHAALLTWILETTCQFFSGFQRPHQEIEMHPKDRLNGLY